jgi:catechol 2,3-dioxygenase-like lactoylglutathione lyase family enzyme
MITPTLGLAQLVVRDLSVARDWYRDVLGLPLISESAGDGGDGRYATFHAGGLLLVLLEATEGLPQQPPGGRVTAFNLHFQIEEDPAEVFDQLRAAGADVVEEWTVSKNFQTFYVHDPDGHRIEISRATTATGSRLTTEAGRGTAE